MAPELLAWPLGGTLATTTTTTTTNDDDDDDDYEPIDRQSSNNKERGCTGCNCCLRGCCFLGFTCITIIIITTEGLYHFLPLYSLPTGAPMLRPPQRAAWLAHCLPALTCPD